MSASPRPRSSSAVHMPSNFDRPPSPRSSGTARTVRFVPVPTTNEPQYPIAFSRGNARVDDLSTWVGLTAASALLFGPLRWVILASGRLGRRHLLHRLERIWATVMIRKLGIHVTVSGLDRVDLDQEYVIVIAAVANGAGEVSVRSSVREREHRAAEDRSTAIGSDHASEHQRLR